MDKTENVVSAGEIKAIEGSERIRYSAEELLGKSRTHDEVIKLIDSDPIMKEQFDRLKPEMKEQVTGFLEGKRSLPILYDNFFLRIFDPYIHRDRIESLISALIGQKVKIQDILPREGFRVSEKGSFVIFDIIVELENGSFVNVEVQKIGYMFPSQRTSCYASDIIMRQYNKKKAEKKDEFTYRDICPVYIFVLMERSPEEFKKSTEHIHRRKTFYSSGIELEETARITYVTLDSFNIPTQNIDNELDKWLAFFTRDDIESVINLVNRYPEFADIYAEIAEFRTDPREVMNMFSEALAIMDRNTERFMVEEMKKEIEDLTIKRNEIAKDRDEIAKDRDEIAKDRDEITKDRDEIAKDRDKYKAFILEKGFDISELENFQN